METIKNTIKSRNARLRFLSVPHMVKDFLESSLTPVTHSDIINAEKDNDRSDEEVLKFFSN